MVRVREMTISCRSKPIFFFSKRKCHNPRHEQNVANGTTGRVVDSGTREICGSNPGPVHRLVEDFSYILIAIKKWQLRLNKTTNWFDSRLPSEVVATMVVSLYSQALIDSVQLNHYLALGDYASITLQLVKMFTN